VDFWYTEDSFSLYLDFAYFFKNSQFFKNYQNKQTVETDSRIDHWIFDNLLEYYFSFFEEIFFVAS
jgi:hypothetical protein